MLKKLYILIVLSSISTSIFAQSSVLNSGTWYKLAIPNTGIYKLDYTFFQNTLGVSLSSINPKKIKIYGNGGTMLPQANNAFRYTDLEENNIFVSGENDGVFNNSDYVLFYAQGTINWKLNGDSTGFIHTNNIYSDTAYYFLNFEGNDGKRIGSIPSESNSTATITTFDEHYVYEKEELNLIKSGRLWFSDRFDVELNRSFSITLVGYLENSPFTLNASLVGGSPKANSFTLKQNNNILGTVSFTSYTATDDYHRAGDIRLTQYSNLTNANSNISVDLTYTTNGATEAKGYVDYFEFNYKRDLSILGSATIFRAIQSLNQEKTAYEVKNAFSTTKIWNITDPLHPFEQEYTLIGTKASFVESASELQEYIAFSSTSFSSPLYKGKIANQNLHEISIPTLLIITHPDFKEAAQTLADFRLEHDNMEVEIVEIEQVYNEFSSGKQDITAIRDFAKSIYNRDGNNKFKYLLLFGDCSYDYKNRIPGNTNFIPVYEAIESLSPTNTYSSDDYYGFFDDNEGEWRESPSDADKLNIGVGRIISKTSNEAAQIVNKIIHYSKNELNLGKWKNEITLIGDDGNGNSHLSSAEAYSKLIETNYKEYNVNKVYIDAYPQIPTATGQRAPEVNDVLNRKIETGSFITNYTGHGGELGLAHEKILTNEMINNWNNIDKLTLLFTATCEFGRYDDPERVSAGENTFLNPNGGSIAIITTSRPVYSSSNNKINTAFFTSVFEPMPDGTMPRLGDLMIKTKNGSVDGINNRNFTLLGDPSMRLAYPVNKIVITEINDSILQPNADTLKALTKVTFKGEIRNKSGVKENTFNGILDVKVLDKKSSINTLGDESTPISFEMYKDIIFNGKATVTNGDFSFAFVVPKDINYKYGNGKFSFYAKTTDKTLNIDAHGYNDEIVIGGSNSNAAEDNQPPIVKSFMDDFSFVFGGMTGTDPMLLGKLSDDNGINTAGSGIGHEITAIIDEDRENLIVLNDFYSSALNDYTQGTVEYPIYDLEPGNHTLRLKAWDVYNNSGEDYLEFVVVEEGGIKISHLLNYPNPFSTRTNFHFDHNRAGDDLDVKIQIFTLSGKVVRTLLFESFASPSHIESSDYFDGRDEWGDQLAKGVYIYKATIRSKSDGEQVTEFEKLLLLK